MIFCNITGGLGNQLFQIFATISYAVRNKHSFGFPLVINQGITNRPSYWDNFLDTIKLFTHPVIPLMDVLREKSFGYTELPEYNDEKPNILLHGYFQSYKYFEGHYTFICRLIRLDKKKLAVQLKYSNDYSNITSMHFRLGDYKGLQEFHPILTYEYYRNSLKHIENIYNKNKNRFPRTVLIFCEKESNNEVFDIIHKLSNEFPRYKFIKQNDDVADWEQILLMSLCRNNIIANSTFSWWGAYFNSNPEKIVCYPEKWFGPRLSKNDTADLFPENWHKIRG